jgi:hypothetical protein
MDDPIEVCRLRFPDSRKRLRECALEYLWEQGCAPLEFLTALPKEILGMIVERCDVSKLTFTTLLLLNKEKISPVVWRHYRFPKGWNWEKLMSRILYKKEALPHGWRPKLGPLYGMKTTDDLLSHTVKYCSKYVVSQISEFLKSNHKTDVFLYSAMDYVSDPNHIVSLLMTLFALYNPLRDGPIICRLFKRLSCIVTGDTPLLIQYSDPAPVPDCLASLKKSLDNVHIALGYYNAYREYTKRDYGMTLPKIKMSK